MDIYIYIYTYIDASGIFGPAIGGGSSKRTPRSPGLLSSEERCCFIHSALQLRRHGVSDGSGRLIAVPGCKGAFAGQSGESDKPRTEPNQDQNKRGCHYYYYCCDDCCDEYSYCYYCYHYYYYYHNIYIYIYMYMYMYISISLSLYIYIYISISIVSYYCLAFSSLLCLLHECYFCGAGCAH